MEKRDWNYDIDYRCNAHMQSGDVARPIFVLTADSLIKPRQLCVGFILIFFLHKKKQIYWGLSIQLQDLLFKIFTCPNHPPPLCLYVYVTTSCT